MNTDVDHTEYAFELTPSEKEQYFSLVYNREKADRRRKFVQEGMNRRQDHGSRGSRRKQEILTKTEFNKKKSEKSLACLRRDFRAAGRQITGTL